MIWSLIVIALLLGLLIFIMVTPFILKIDTGKNDYTLQWKGIVSVSIVPVYDELLFIRYRIFFLRTAIIR